MRRSTLAYLLALLIAVGAYYFVNNRKETTENAATAEPTEAIVYLFDAEDGVPSSIRIEAKTGETVEVAKNADNAWALIQPLKASADQSAPEAAVSQLTTLQIEDTIPNLDLEIVGLNDPEYAVIVRYSDKVERKVAIGVITPTENGYYALSPSGDVVVVDKASIDSLLNLLRNPPYLETPTPSPVPTETPLPSSTPEPATPTSTASAP
ncbi:MAG: hypothetical protein MHPDNHAH_03320 [Anaerolineales bacterium]|nr:hypothetical protein [Anaerolineales bacterium]WKZ48378.1 MAG: DUF4340 domain-containing protein [Anaerolineales bacterium]